jgi:hypothetical protein
VLVLEPPEPPKDPTILTIGPKTEYMTKLFEVVDFINKMLEDSKQGFCKGLVKNMPSLEKFKDFGTYEPKILDPLGSDEPRILSRLDTHQRDSESEIIRRSWDSSSYFGSPQKIREIRERSWDPMLPIRVSRIIDEKYAKYWRQFAERAEKHLRTDEYMGPSDSFDSREFALDRWERAFDNESIREIKQFLSRKEPHKEAHNYRYHRDPWKHHDGRRRTDFEEEQFVRVRSCDTRARQMEAEQERRAAAEQQRIERIERERREREQSRLYRWRITKGMACPFDLDAQKKYLKSLGLPDEMASRISRKIKTNFINPFIDGDFFPGWYFGSFCGDGMSVKELIQDTITICKYLWFRFGGDYKQIINESGTLKKYYKGDAVSVSKSKSLGCFPSMGRRFPAKFVCPPEKNRGGFAGISGKKPVDEENYEKDSPSYEAGYNGRTFICRDREFYTGEKSPWAWRYNDRRALV